MRKLLFGLAILAANFAHAHGGDKPGPNNGFIKMPGGFHTEVVPVEKGFKIYLLDAEFKNPTIEDSSVKATLKQKSKSEEGTCIAKTTHFECAFASGNLKSGQLEVLAVRKKAPGNSAVYSLPLKLESHH